jgi:hypothetical protein
MARAPDQIDNTALERFRVREHLPEQIVDAVGRLVRAEMDYERQYRNNGSEGPSYTASVEKSAAEDVLTNLLKKIVP